LERGNINRLVESLIIFFISYHKEKRQKMKAIVVIMDGAGDRPIKELEGKTPLEAAKTPNLDRMASSGINGVMDSITPGVTPGSDTSHLSIFGLDPKQYYHGRGPLEVLGVGVNLKKGDVAFRANVGTVENGKVIDRRAGRIESTVEFCKELDGIQIEDVTIILKPSAWYRAALVLRGPGISDKVGSNDSKKTDVPIQEVKPLDGSPEAKKTARILNQLSKLSNEKFENLSINKNRIKEGKLPGNILLFRGAGHYEPAPTLEEKFGIKSACIAGGGLYKGIARYMGMDVIDVPGATGKYDSDFTVKTKKAKQIIKDYDFLFIHMKATDSAGEDGNYELKTEMLEKMDIALGELLDIPDCIIIVTADHTTPCELKKHSYEPVPIVMMAPGIRVDDVVKYSERSCAKGGLLRIKGCDIMPIVSSHMGVAKLYGA
jgi:2,3-bisphosphoglycerate-independent phosphoglycerate mutase